MPLSVYQQKSYAVDTNLIEHNSVGIIVQVRLINRLAKFLLKKQRNLKLTFQTGITVGDMMTHFGISKSNVFLALCNGRVVTPDLGDDINVGYQFTEGDVISLSGPILYSWVYGSSSVAFILSQDAFWLLC